MKFKQFIEELSTADFQMPGSSIGNPRNGVNNQDTTFTHTTDASPNGQFNGKSATSNKLKALMNALKTLDPFIGKRNYGYIVGTADYMPPEQGKQSSKTDSDSITNFYLTIRNTHPEAANIFKSVVPLFKTFHDVILKAMENSNLKENVELAYRLDLRTSKQLNQGVDQVKSCLTQFAPAEAQQIGPLFQQAINLYQSFYSSFKNVMPQVEKYLNHAYSQVSSQSWNNQKGN